MAARSRACRHRQTSGERVQRDRCGRAGNRNDHAEHNGRVVAGERHVVGCHCAIDSNGLPSVPSNITIIGTSPSGDGHFHLQASYGRRSRGSSPTCCSSGRKPDLICAQATGTLTAGTGNTYTPSSITFGGPVVRSTWALPSPYVAKVRIKAKLLLHSGVAGVAVTTVSTNTLVCSELVDTSSTPFSPVGRILSVIGTAQRQHAVCELQHHRVRSDHGDDNARPRSHRDRQRGRCGGHSQQIELVEHPRLCHPGH